jgi:hypothetical protein
MLAFLSVGFSAKAQASNTDKCIALTSAPVTISTPGVYCLTANIILPNTFSSGIAITVGSDNVTIDLGGNALSDLAAGTGTQAIGVGALGSQATSRFVMAP